MAETLAPHAAAAAAPAAASPWIDAILVLQKSDLARLAAVPALAAGQRLLFVDPGLLDEAMVRGFQRCEFRRLNEDIDFQARAATEAMTLATLIDARLTRERQGLWAGPGAAPSLHGWDVGLFFLALQRAVVARQLGDAIAAGFAERRLGVLRPTTVQQMYFDSFVGTDLVARDPARFALIDAYDDTRWHRADAYAQVFDAAALRAAMGGGRVCAVTHVPTCFYDRAWLADEVSRAHAYTLDLPSPFWDVPLHRGTAPLHVPRPADDERTRRYREGVCRVLGETLADLLPQPAARAAQLDAWADRAAWQAQNFAALHAGLAGTRPTLVLSDQDAGLNGPLFSVADALGASVTVVPHSGHPSMLLPHARRVTAVERAGYGCQPRTVLGQRVTMRPVRYAQRVARREHGPVRSVCLLLNSMQTEGLSHVDTHALARFHTALSVLCDAARVELLLRPKPGAPALSVLAGALGVDAARLVQHVTQPLEQLAERTQLCIAWGEPTTGVAPFLDGGSLVLQVHPQCWPADYTVCLPLVHDGVIPLLDHAQALDQLRRLLADAQAFDAERRAQNRAFDARCRLAADHLF